MVGAGALETAPNEHASAAQGPGNIKQRPGFDGDFRRLENDLAAGLRTRLHGAAVDDLLGRANNDFLARDHLTAVAYLAAACQQDAAAFFRYAVGAHNAAVVDRKRVFIAAGSTQFSCGPLDMATVDDLALAGADRNPPVARIDRAQQYFLARAKADITAVRFDPAGFADLDLARQQEDVAAGHRADSAMHGDAAAGLDTLAEQHVAGAEEVGIGDIERRGDEAAGVDQTAGADQNTVFVDEEDLAVRFQRAVDFGDIAAGHPV